MFQLGNIQGIAKCILLSVLASECFAAVNRDDNIYNFTTRRPFVGEQNTVSSHPQLSDYNDDASLVDQTDMIVFFVVCSFSALFIGILIYILKRKETTSSSSTSGAVNFPRIPGAVVHPPPTRLVSPTAPVVSYLNTGYQPEASTVVDGRSSDGPPDYATVTIGDLSSTDRSRYPMVMPKLETPPPNYQGGHPFS